MMNKEECSHNYHHIVLYHMTYLSSDLPMNCVCRDDGPFQEKTFSKLYPEILYKESSKDNQILFLIYMHIVQIYHLTLVNFVPNFVASTFRVADNS